MTESVVTGLVRKTVADDVHRGILDDCVFPPKVVDETEYDGELDVSVSVRRSGVAELHFAEFVIEDGERGVPELLLCMGDGAWEREVELVAVGED